MSIEDKRLMLFFIGLHHLLALAPLSFGKAIIYVHSKVTLHLLICVYSNLNYLMLPHLTE